MKNSLNEQITNVEELVQKNVISPKFGTFLIGYLIKKDVHNQVKETVGDLLRNHREYEQKFALNYSRKRTSFR